jgi:hypothetical protein
VLHRDDPLPNPNKSLIDSVHNGIMLAAMTRTRMLLTVSSLGLAAVLGLAGCATTPATANVSDEVAALQAIGFDTGLAAEPTPAPSVSAGAKAGKQRRAAVRKYLRKNTLHGEITVQGRDGVRTIVVQRGTVTAVSAGGVSVRSADGFALTWTYGDKLRVVQDRRTVATSALKNGAEIGVAGARNGSATAARLIVIK